MKIGKMLGLAVSYIAVMAVSILGYSYITRKKLDPSVIVTKFSAGKTTFCDLDENARLYVCPMMRRAFPVGQSGGVLLYVCSTSKGFVDMIGLSPESKMAVKSKLLESGFVAKPYCGKTDREVFVVERVPWKII